MFDWLKKLLFDRDGKKPAAKDLAAKEPTHSQAKVQSAKNRAERRVKDRAEKDQAERRGFVTFTCKECGKTFTLPENVQHWPDYCQECRAKYHPDEPVTRKCRRCGKSFTFPSDARPWPRYCPECQEKKGRKGRKSR